MQPGINKKAFGPALDRSFWIEKVFYGIDPKGGRGFEI